ncbi:MAG: hypothetical protein HQL24_03595 [Candidatus Omnitrophica bacterium]|nr:hypothetical protein [Candidatus Omnitrophota bacterium]
MIFLLLGEDSSAKDRKIDEIKKKYLPSDQSLAFDYIALQSIKLDPATLKKSLIALPVVSPKRVIVLRNIQKLSPQNKEIILDFLKSGQDHAVVILDSDEAGLKNSFIDKLLPEAKVFSFSARQKSDVFQMTNAMEAGKSTEALKILAELLEAGEYPLKMMGALVWFWGKKMKRRLSSDQFKKGLQVLQEADLNIKRSRMEPDAAIEFAVVKLCCLLAC